MAKILICEDNEDMGDVCKRACTRLNVGLKTVKRPDDALREITTAGYAMVMLDLQNLYRWGGCHIGHMYDYAGRVKSTQPDTKVVGISSNPQQFLDDDANEYFDDIVEKRELVHQMGDNPYSGWERLLRKHLVI